MQEQLIAERAKALVELGKIDEAIEVLGAGLVDFAESSLLWSLLAWAQLDGDDPPTARVAAGRAIGLDPDNILALYVLAHLEILAGASDRAHELADRLLRLAPENSTAHLTKARAYASEQNGAWRHRDIIRQAAYYAVSLAQEDSEVLRQAALILEPVSPKPEVIALVERGLAANPEDSELQLMLVRLQSKSDVQTVRGWTRVLAGDPSQPALVLGVNMMIWERTRMLVSFALWAIPAFVIPVAGLMVLGIGIRNAWDLLVAMPRSMPKGALQRVWSTPRWARIGVACCLISAVWPVLILPAALSGQTILLAVVPLIMLLGETLVVLTMGRIEQNGLAQLAPRAVAEVAQELARQAGNGWARIALGSVGLITGVLLMAASFAVGAATMVGAVLLLCFATAFAVPPITVLAHSRRLRREYPNANVVAEHLGG